MEQACSNLSGEPYHCQICGEILFLHSDEEVVGQRVTLAFCKNECTGDGSPWLIFEDDSDSVTQTMDTFMMPNWSKLKDFDPEKIYDMRRELFK